MISWAIRQSLLAAASCALAIFLYGITISHAAANESASLPPPSGKTVLTVHGAITNTNIEDEAHFDQAMLEALPLTQLKTHTSVTDGIHVFDGFLVRDLLALLGTKGNTVKATALNHYQIDFSIEDFNEYDIILAYSMDGERLLPKDKGPLWIVYPRDEHPELQDIRYDYRWVWQVIRLDIL